MPTARTVAELIEYHERSVVALQVLDSAFDSLDEANKKSFLPRGERMVEVLENMRDELDDQVVLAMVASAERTLRLDFRARLGGKDAVAVRFGTLDQRFHRHVPLEEVIDVWKAPKASSECGAFKQMYVYRHGLAHGRYFNKSGLHDTNPKDAAGVVGEFFKHIGTHSPDFPRQ